MDRLRTAWLAVLGGVLLLTLSVSAAFGAPTRTASVGNEWSTFGQQVSSYIHGLLAEDGDEDGDPDGALAQGTDVGGVKANHGGAVSYAARVTCREAVNEVDVEVDEDEVDEDDVGDEEVDTTKADRQAARDQAKAEKMAAKAEKMAARDEAKADKMAARDEAKADEQADKQHANGKTSRGHGHGRGQRP